MVNENFRRFVRKGAMVGKVLSEIRRIEHCDRWKSNEIRYVKGHDVTYTVNHHRCYQRRVVTSFSRNSVN
jgi:hypothetical protein